MIINYSKFMDYGKFDHRNPFEYPFVYENKGISNIIVSVLKESYFHELKLIKPDVNIIKRRLKIYELEKKIK